MTEITLSPSQQHVIDEFPEFLLNEDQEMTIAGFAGSGKSFLVEYLADMGEQQQKLVKLLDPNIPIRDMVFTATTNKAAAVLRVMLKREVNTIHRTLGLKVKNDYRTGKQYLKDDSNCEPLDHTILFIDEASMVNRELLTVIQRKTKKFKDCKVIYIGDSYQLPPVMEDVCPVFKNTENVFDLKEIQRQVAGSPIIKLSAEYRACLDDHTLDWPTLISNAPAIIHHSRKESFFREIENRFTKPHESSDYKVLAWANTRVRDYNIWIRKMQGRLHPYEPGEVMVSNKPLFSGRNIVAPTDSFHTISNIWETTTDGIPGYYLELEQFPGYKFFQPTSWDKANALSKVYAAEKDWSSFFDIKERWADLRPVHASTVHKAQGSTYREVFVDLNNIGKCTRWRDVCRLVYVAITRASDTVHIFGNLTGSYNKQAPIDLMEPFKNVNCL